MKKVTLLILALLGSVTLMAQLQRSIPAITRQIPQPPEQNKELAAKARGNVFLDFETYSDFTLNISPWSTIDVDGYVTYGIEGYTFPHMGEAMSYIVFNPGSATPSLIEDPALLPHGGYKYAACFASQTHANNDWIISPLVEIGPNGHLKFWVKSYTVNFGLERYKVGVSTTTPEPSSFTIISSGSYLEAPAAAWEQKDFDLSAYNGMDIYVGIQCVSNDAFIFMLDDFEITSESMVNSSLTGKVTDAVTGNPIPNAQVSVAGLNDVTDASGNYAINNIPEGVLNANFTATPISGNAPLAVQFTDISTEGSHAVTATATGYTNYNNSQVAIPNGGTLELQIALSPSLANGQYRFVLSWGETPSDLDAHLKTPLIEGNPYDVYYDNKGSADSPPFIIMDIDDQNSYGPETTTIYDLKDGQYHFYIHNHSGSPEITSSNAVVQIFNDDGLLKTLQVPNSGTGSYWDVCTMNGSNGNISIINAIVETEPGGSPKLSPDKSKTKPVPAGRNIVSWNWNFGDGGTSTARNPAHTYAANGSYTVSLTVSDGQNTNVETKSNFVNVGPASVEEVSWEKDISIYPNPVKDQLHINSGLRLDAVALYDINGKEILKKTDCGFEYEVNLNGFHEGVYILQIFTEKGSMQRKVNVSK